MATLRLLPAQQGAGHEGEVLACAFSHEGTAVLSAGWDGQLRLWDVGTGEVLVSAAASPKPLSACAILPGGEQWLTGSMEGLLTHWDAHSQRPLHQFLAHTRPISAIAVSPEGTQVATASWDRTAALRVPGKERELQTLHGHDDIVGGCCFSPEGGRLVSWSHDQTLRLWDLTTGQVSRRLTDHRDRVTAATFSPDGCWLASTARNGELILWEVESAQRQEALRQGVELRGCFFLLDGESVLTVDRQGRVILFSVPELEVLDQLALQVPTQCGALSPTGRHLALGNDDGLVRFLAIDGMEEQPLVVTAIQGERTIATRLQRWLGRSQIQRFFQASCPACLQSFELLRQLPSDPWPCPHCGHLLRFNRTTRPAAQVS